MVEEIERGGPVFVIEVLLSFLVSDVKPDLEQ